MRDEAVTTGPAEGAGIRITGILQITALIAPLLAIYAALGVAPLLAVSAVAILAISLYEKKRLLISEWRLALPLLLLLLWGALSAFWAVSPAGAIKTEAQLVGIFIAGAIIIGSARRLSAAEATRVQRMLVLSIAAALTIYCIEIVFDAPIEALIRHTQPELEAIYSPFNRGLALLVLVIPPAAIALRRSGRAAIGAAILLLGLIVVFAYFGMSIQIAVLAGIGAALLAAARPVIIRWLGVLAASLVIIAPLVAGLVITQRLIETVVQQTDNVSGPHRLVIWRFAAERIRERPVIGWGLDSARVIPGGKDRVPLRMKNEDEARMVERLPLHTHDFALQWWLELGLPGALLGAAFIALVFSAIAGMPVDRIDKAVLTGQATVALGIYGLGYGAWQSWWLATLVLAMAFSRVAAAVRAGVTAPETAPLGR
jgi:O-antigen ligase